MRMFKKSVWILLLLSAALLLPLAAQAQSGQVSGLVWLDKTADGVFSNESGLTGAVVVLEQQAEDGGIIEIDKAVTDRNGNYSLFVPDAGDYRLRIELPADYHFTLHGLASDALPAQGRVSVTPFFHVSGGQNVSKYIGAVKGAAAVTVVVFEDLNANGGRMNTEPVIGRVQVDVVYTYAGETYVVASDATARDGQVVIKDLSPGTYRIRVLLPDNYAAGPLGQKVSMWYNCCLPDTDDACISDPFTVSLKENLGLAAGLVRAGSVTGGLWYDANFNGVWDSEEGGLRGAAITLRSFAQNDVRQTVADENGAYSFARLQPGDYRLEITLPEGMVFTYSVAGSTLISTPTSRGSLSLAVQEGVTTRLGPVGAMPATALSVSLFADLNGNGVRDDNEPGLPGASVAASQGGSTVDTLRTDDQGAARYSAMRGGDTVLTVSLPDGAVFASDPNVLVTVDGAQSQARISFFLDSAQTETSLALPVTYPASVSGVFFEDPGNTGVYQAGSAFLGGFTVQAVDGQGRVAAESVTDGNGRYVLSPLLPGEYSVRFLLGDTYVASPFAADQSGVVNHIQSQTPEYGETDRLVLAAGENRTDVNGGVFRAGVVDGYVLLSGQSGGLQGVTVSLLDQQLHIVSDYAYGVTDANGFFSIKGVEPGTYSLLYSLPENGAFTNPRTDERTARSQVFTCASGSQIHMPALAGEYTSVLAGRILSDAQTAVSAELTLTNQATGAVLSGTTDENSMYRFAGLRPGVYTLDITLPEGLVFGYLASSPIPATPSRHASATFAFASGENVESADIRAALPLILSGRVFYDDDLSGAQNGDESGAEGRVLTIWLAGEEISSAETDGEGNFRISQLVPGTYELRMALDENEIVTGQTVLGDSEWRLPLELTGDQAVSAPVVRYASLSGRVWSLDGSLRGVSGLTVTLVSDEGASIGSVVTDEEGGYVFSGLLPGDYHLEMALPDNYLFAKAQDAAQQDSFILADESGAPQCLSFTVPMGDELSGIDVGIGAMGGIGDQAWLDVNGNGMQDVGEPCMPGIVIELYKQDVLAASAVTDEYGRYKLTGLNPGEYTMRVVMHPELRATLHQTEFPLVASIMPDDSDETELIFSGVVVPSGAMNLHCDLGFQLRVEGVYPAAMDETPQKDWRPYNNR